MHPWQFWAHMNSFSCLSSKAVRQPKVLFRPQAEVSSYNQSHIPFTTGVFQVILCALEALDLIYLLANRTTSPFQRVKAPRRFSKNK